MAGTSEIWVTGWRRQVGRHRLGGEAVVQQHAGPGARAAPENGLAADVVERQASQPEVAGAHSSCGGIKIAVTQHDCLGLAFAATGTDDQRDVWGKRGALIRNVAVDRPECPIFYAAA
jgi:hypothetical protein